MGVSLCYSLFNTSLLCKSPCAGLLKAGDYSGDYLSALPGALLSILVCFPSTGRGRFLSAWHVASLKTASTYYQSELLPCRPALFQPKVLPRPTPQPAIKILRSVSYKATLCQYNSCPFSCLDFRFPSLCADPQQ